MSELQAVENQSCPACGAHARWDPAKRALVCPYCGTEAPAELDTDAGKIREIPLVQTLRDLPEELRGWKAEKKSVQCRSCRAISVFDAERVGQRCAFCGSPEIVPYDEIKSPLRPQSVLPFTISESRVRESMRAWYRSKWLAPGALRKRAALDTVRGVYLPYWTFDAQVRAQWRADSGTYYYTTEQVRDAEGKVQTRQVRHVRWQPAAGRLEHFFDDEPVPGSTGVHPALLRAIEPFPGSDLVPYDTAYLSGFVVEHYQVVLIDAARSARETMEAKLRGLCAAQVPGDTHRNLVVEGDFSAETFKHILAPVWLLVYQFRGRDHQVVVNGHTGRIAGEYPKSPWKIAALIVLGLALAAVLALVASSSG
jgi:hypothetical protein